MNANSDPDLDYDLNITKTTRRLSGGGTWVMGTIDGFRFEALVFPEHAENANWEIDDSRISKLWLNSLQTKETVFNWDRGMDIPAASKQVQALADFLCVGLADHVFAE
jgi:hypothetical protein